MDARGDGAGRGVLFETWPALSEVMPRVVLGTWPTPLEAKVVRGHEVLFKREDLSAEGYAGNKIRPLEMVFGAAREAGLTEIWSTGAYGSNHALAAVVHARRQGLFGGAILWPQPWSQTAQDNVLATLGVADEVRWARSIAEVPLIGLPIRWRRAAWVMPPGAATPLGATGHASAALELGAQLSERRQPIDAIVLPVGSTCTTAGLLVGTALAHAAGLFPGRPPRIVAVRVTPWPVTAAWRVARLAAATAARLAGLFARAGLTMPAFARGAADFAARLEVVGDELGPGYGEPTPRGWEMLAAMSHLGVRLDTTYSAKAAAHLARRIDHMSGQVGQRPERLVFWATKSAVPLPPVDRARTPPAPLARWLRGRW